jgi:hypothetical protein
MNNTFQKQALTLDEKEIVDELVVVAGGMASYERTHTPNGEQRAAIEGFRP